MLTDQNKQKLIFSLSLSTLDQRLIATKMEISGQVLLKN